MNKTKIRETAHALLNGTLATHKRGTPIGYNQNTFGSGPETNFEDRSGHACGTVACIAGWVVALDGKDPTKVRDASNKARIILGLSQYQAAELFGVPDIDRHVTSKDAALVLFNLAETGKVDWDVVK